MTDFWKLENMGIPADAARQIREQHEREMRALPESELVGQQPRFDYAKVKDYAQRMGLDTSLSDPAALAGLTNAPKRIWLQDGDYLDYRDEIPPADFYAGNDDLTWCGDQINDEDTEYIRLDIHQHELTQVIRERNKARRDANMLLTIANELRAVVSCDRLHHKRNELHQGAECPVETRIDAAIDTAMESKHD